MLLRNLASERDAIASRKQRREVGVSVINRVRDVAFEEPLDARALEQVALGVLLVAREVVDGGRGDGGIEQRLVGDLRAAAIPSHQRHRGREVAAGAVTGDCDPVGVAVDAVGMSVSPLDGGVGVLNGRRERMFGREAVVDREHRAVGGVRERPADVVVALQPAEHPATPR